MTLKVGAFVTFRDVKHEEVQEAVDRGGVIWKLERIGFISSDIKSISNGKTIMAWSHHLVEII